MHRKGNLLALETVPSRISCYSDIPMSAVTPSASSGLTPRAVLMLVLPPLLWAGNAVVGRAVAGLIPPVTFNLVRCHCAAP